MKSGQQPSTTSNRSRMHEAKTIKEKEIKKEIIELSQWLVCIVEYYYHNCYIILYTNE